jgi:hypothetical protein
VGRTMALLVTASLNFPNKWARKHSPHMPIPPGAATAAPPHLPHVVEAAPEIEDRPIRSSGASSTALPEEEQWGPQPAPPQAEEAAAAAMAGARVLARGFRFPRLEAVRDLGLSGSWSSPNNYKVPGP